MIYKKVFSIFFAALLSAAAFAQGETDDFSGKWKTEEGDVIVISKSAAGFVGEAEKKKIVILKDINFSDGKWLSAIYNPKKDVTADCELYLEGNQLKIVASKGLFSKTVIWTKEI
jgi:uncharacterized protein (DUF2147 family)